MAPLGLKVGLLLLSAGQVLADSPCLIEDFMATCNRIDTLPSLPSDVTSLLVIDSPVNKLESSFFGSETLRNVNELDITGGDITKISPQAFTGLPNLEVLRLASTKTSSLSAGVLQGLNLLKDFIVVDSLIEDIPSGLFQDVSSTLVTILMERNKIKDIADGAFSGIPNLKFLNLDSNSLSNLRPNMFEGMPDLRGLFLRGNQINNLPPQVFSSLLNLRNLNLTNNQLESLAAASLEGLERLETLILNQNKLINLEPGTFRTLRDLEEFYIRDNLLTELNSGFFEGLSNLRILSLTGNQISKIETDAFRDLSELRTLILQHNKLRTIEGFTNLPTLANVDLQNNEITEVPSGAFAGVPQLEDVNLSYNTALRTINQDAFSSNAHLKTLYLEGCTYLELPTDRPLINSPSLTYINMDRSEIYGLVDMMFEGLPELQRISLKYNNLATVVAYPFRSLKRGSIVEVAYNPIVCECALNEMLQWSKEHNVRLEGTCSGNGEENALLSEVEITDCG